MPLFFFFFSFPQLVPLILLPPFIIYAEIKSYPFQISCCQMLFFLITCVSFIFFYNNLPLKPLPQWASEIRLVSLWFWKDLSFLPISNFLKTITSFHFIQIPSKMSMKKRNPTSKVENFDESTTEENEICLLDLPELVLESILERLRPDGLCSMAGVCSALRDRCTSDRLWERHMKRKWGRVIGPARPPGVAVANGF